MYTAHCSELCIYGVFANDAPKIALINAQMDCWWNSAVENQGICAVNIMIWCPTFVPQLSIESTDWDKIRPFTLSTSSYVIMSHVTLYLKFDDFNR